MSEPRRFFFVHLQKTAGTALYRRLRDSLGEAAVYPSAAEKQQRIDAVLDVAYMQRCFEARRDEIRVITGHFPLCVSEILGVPFSTFTVLRDPVERTLSFLRHHKQLEVDAADMSFEAIYADPVRLHGLIHNHMVKMLSLTRDEMSHGAMTLVEFDDQRLEVAKQNLAERIDVFGLQENFEPFCDLLSARYGWDLGSPRYANRTKPEEVSDEFRAVIARDNRLDIELYEYADQLWKERSERPCAG